jgi:hypothetical protein
MIQIKFVGMPTSLLDSIYGFNVTFNKLTILLNLIKCTNYFKRYYGEKDWRDKGCGPHKP